MRIGYLQEMLGSDATDSDAERMYDYLVEALRAAGDEDPSGHIETRCTPGFNGCGHPDDAAFDAAWEIALVKMGEDDFDPEHDDELEAERDAGIAPEDRDETKPSRLMIRTLSRCPNTPSEWQWTEAVDADAPDGASVEDYVEVMHDSHTETHIGVYLVERIVADGLTALLGIEDIRGRIHRECGQLVAWVSVDGETVSYELVSEE